MAIGFVVAACSGSSEDSDGEAGGGCDDITGNYDVLVTRLSGDCPGSKTGTTKASITIGNQGTSLAVFLPGLNGGCEGSLAAGTCRFQAQCVVTQGSQSVMYNVDYTFSGRTFTGSFVAAATEGVFSDGPCKATVKHEGTRL